MNRVQHPVFARVYQRISHVAEAKGASDYRGRLLAGLHGRVIEVGAGNGLNFSHYPSTVTEVVAIEPESFLPRPSWRGGSLGLDSDNDPRWNG